MIRNIISFAVLLAALISLASIAQIVNAVEPELNLDISAYETDLATHRHPITWTPDLAQQKRIIRFYERLLLPKSVDASSLFDDEDSDQRIFSFEIYQGDGLDDLRLRSNYHGLTLPDEDTDAYGVSIKQRF